MRAVYITKYGAADKAFELREADIPNLEPHHIRIKSKGFGLNFADVMARLGVYPEAPPKPALIGYDVMGYIDAIGPEAKTDLKVGDHVLALCRFGGYAEYVSTDYRGVVAIPEGINIAQGTALATQGGTACYMAELMTNILPDDQVLIHAAAGGVGSLLCQIAKSKEAIVWGTVGSDEKLDYLRSLDVDYPINYRREKFEQVIQEQLTRGGSAGLDIVYDAVGGSSVKKGFKLLGAGGRMVMFGAASLTSAKHIFSKLGVVIGFGLHSPLGLLDPSKSLIGVNMLKIADNKPEILQRVLRQAVAHFDAGIIRPKVGGIYPVEQLAEAHDALEKRKTMGKIAVTW